MKFIGQIIICTIILNKDETPTNKLLNKFIYPEKIVN